MAALAAANAAKTTPVKHLLTGTIPALITPFKRTSAEQDPATFALDCEAVKPIVDHMVQQKCGGLYICGTTGEGFVMTAEERRAMAAASVEAAAGRVPVCVHVGACPRAQAVALAAHAKSVGADAVASVVPGWETDRRENDLGVVTEFFRDIAAAAAPLPFYVYWFACAFKPGEASRASSFTPAEWVASMNTIPTFAGLKFTDINMYTFEQIIAHGGPKLNCLTGPDEMKICGMVMGSHGAIGSTYNVQLPTFVAMDEAFARGDIAAAMAAQRRANAVIALLLRVCKCSEFGGSAIAAGIKCILRLRGLPAGYSRNHAPQLSAEQEQELEREMGRLGEL